MKHTISVEQLYGSTITPLASNSAEKKRMEMITILGANHSPHVEFRVIRGGRDYTYSFLNRAVDKYNE